MEGKFKRLSVLAAGAALVLALGGCDGSSAKGTRSRSAATWK